MAHLTKEQRYVISALRKRGVRQKEIAEELGVSPGTICRELKRNGGKRGGYNAQRAHSLSKERKERYTFKRKFTPSVEKRVRDYLENEPITELNMKNISDIQYKINRRPRKNLNYKQPFKIFGSR